MVRRTWIVYIVLMQVHLSLSQVGDLDLRPCGENKYMDLSKDPPVCRNCTVCSDAKKYTATNCTSANDTVCSRCEPDLIWSEDLARCVRCGPCCSNNKVDSACSEDSSMACIYDPDCNVTTFFPNGFETMNEDGAVPMLYIVIGVVIGVMISFSPFILWHIWQKVRKERKTKERRLDPIFWVKEPHVSDDEDIYDDITEYNFNSRESGQDVVHKSLSTSSFRESRPQNPYVQHPTFLGKTPITEYDELGQPTRFLNLTKTQNNGEDYDYLGIDDTLFEYPKQEENLIHDVPDQYKDSLYNDIDDGKSVHTYCSIRDVPTENPPLEEMTLVKGPDDPVKPSTSTRCYKTTIQVHPSEHQRDQKEVNSTTEDRLGYVGFYQNVKVKIYRSVIMLLGYINAGTTSLVNTLQGLPFISSECKDFDSDDDDFTCNVTCSNVQTKGSDWTPIMEPLHEMLNQELEGTMADVILPRVNDDDSTAASVSAGACQTRCNNETHGLYEFSTVTKIVDACGESGSYKSHQMLISPSTILLLVMDVTKRLDEPLPQKTLEKGFQRPRTPREFLDYWLSTVGTLIDNYDNSGDIKPGKSVIILLTNTDKLDVQTRECEINNYREEIKKYIKAQQTCKHVQKRIFALSNTEGDENEVKVLRQLIYEINSQKYSKVTFGVEVPCSRLKCEADLLDFCKKTGKRWLTFGELHEKIAKPIGISSKELKEFLRFHGKLGNVIFTDAESKDSVIITDINLLTDAFQAIMAVWNCTNCSMWSLDAAAQLEDEIGEGCLSGESLLRIWEQLGAVPADQLASIMVHRHYLIPCGQHSKEQTFESKKFIIPTLLRPCNETLPVGKQPEVSALLYLFHYAPEVEKNFTSVFLPTIVFPMLVGLLMDRNLGEKTWKLENVFSDGAIFKAGESRELLVKLTARGPTVTLESIRVVPETQRESQCAFSRVRSRIDNSIRTILQTHYPNLHCSVCVTPCDSQTIIWNRKCKCLEVLGSIDSIGEVSLSHAHCTEHKLTTEIKHFRCWFCDKFDPGELYQNKDKDVRKVIRRVISKIPQLRTLVEVAEILGVEEHEVLQAHNDSHHQIKETSWFVLRSWFNRTDRSRHELLQQLKNALQRAGVSIDF